MKSKLNNIKNYNRDDILYRVNYYNKINNQFRVSSKSIKNRGLFTRQLTNIKEDVIKKNKSIKKHTTYFFDLYNIFSFFSSDKQLDFIFGDVTQTPATPSIVKSRPIGNSKNSIILNLNKVRHFHFINDNRRFTAKRNEAVWRGGGDYSEARQYFLENYHHVPIFDIGQTTSVNEPWFKGFMSIYDQLSYKFIFCIEGVDTATSIKWVMSSNSICVMPKPKYETWFMEGKLEANIHYIEVNDDFSNAEEKIKHYIKNTDEGLRIIENANDYVNQFKDSEKEKLISLLVLDKYFSMSGQHNA
ncbi:MAG: glycosyl transferase family 90 [Candidatus Marinimicrobia bacterium]|nr:glycosyl transferase family 90 [Candidatus Neomarinimicrobiota bacterium]